MFTNPEQFASATKTLFELQMMTFNVLTSKAVQGVEQVVALNMATARNSVRRRRWRRCPSRAWAARCSTAGR
jgi:hypothetical protein